MKNASAITLRPWHINDLDNLVRYANNPAIAANMTNAFPHPYTLENGTAFIAFANKDNPVHLFAIDLNGQAIGGIGIHPQQDIMCKNAELGYWLAQPFWGQGIVPEAVNQICNWAFNAYDITRIFARPFGRNIASQKVLEKTGFILEATLKQTIFKNGKFEDELIYARRK